MQNHSGDQNNKATVAVVTQSLFTTMIGSSDYERRGSIKLAFTSLDQPSMNASSFRHQKSIHNQIQAFSPELSPEAVL